jgi:hypothetical protein
MSSILKQFLLSAGSQSFKSYVLQLEAHTSTSVHLEKLDLGVNFLLKIAYILFNAK